MLRGSACAQGGFSAHHSGRSSAALALTTNAAGIRSKLERWRPRPLLKHQPQVQSASSYHDNSDGRSQDTYRSRGSTQSTGRSPRQLPEDRRTRTGLKRILPVKKAGETYKSFIAERPRRNIINESDRRCTKDPHVSSRGKLRGASEHKQSWLTRIPRLAVIQHARNHRGSRDRRVNAPLSQTLLRKHEYWYRHLQEDAYVRVNLQAHQSQPTITTAFKRPIRFHLAWYSTFAQVHAHHLPQWSTREFKSRKWRFPFMSLVEQYRRQHPGTRSDKQAITELWGKLGPYRKRRLWMPALLYSLYKHPGTTARLLEAMLVNKPIAVPSHIANDCVAMIVEQLLDRRVARAQKKRSSEAEQVELCYSLVKRYLDVYTPACKGEALLSPRSLSVLVQNANDDQLEGLAAGLLSSGSSLHMVQLRLLSLAFAASGNFERARDMLAHMATVGGGDRHTKHIHTTVACTKILEAATVMGLDYRSRTNLVTFMLEIGVKPDGLMRDVIILSAAMAGDQDTAWQTFEMSVNQGLQPSATTYAYLIPKEMRQTDLQIVSRVHRRAMDDGVLHKSVALGTSLVQSVSTALMPRGHAQRYKYMMMMYRDLFDIKPLQDVGILPATGEATSQMKPSRQVLEAVLSAWIAAAEDPALVKRVYESWISHAENGTSRIAITAENNLVINTFVLKFGELGDLEMSQKIMLKMLAPRPVRWSHLDAVRDGTSMPKSKTEWMLNQSDEVTWNAFLTALLHNRRTDAVWKVYNTMKALRITPNEYTYSMLLDHFARSQDMDNVVYTLHLRRTAGFELDERADKALAAVNDPGRLKAAISSMTVDLGERRILQKGLHDKPDSFAALSDGQADTLTKKLSETRYGIPSGHRSHRKHMLANAAWRRRSFLLGTDIPGYQKT